MELPKHFEAAGMMIKAAEYLLRAGHLALSNDSSMEAINSFETGLHLISAYPDPQKGTYSQEIENFRRSIGDIKLLLQESTIVANSYLNENRPEI